MSDDCDCDDEHEHDYFQVGDMDNPIPLYGLMAEYDDPERLLSAARRARAEGYRNVEAYSPFPIEGLSEEVGFPKTRLPAIVLIAGILGGLTGYLMQVIACKIHYPLNVGGRPLHSWPTFIPLTFELTVLFASIAAVVGMLMLNGLPEPYHPVFNEPRFTLASRDRFFLCILAGDPKFDRNETQKMLNDTGAATVSEVTS